MLYMENRKLIHKKHVLELIQKADEHFKMEPNIIEITVPKNGVLSVCGDLHGQYYDLLNIFKINGNPSPTNAYVFNGDFVDRGSFSVEVIITLLAWKCVFPDFVHLIRGNHENKQIHKFHGFKKETEAKYDADVYKIFSRMFTSLPLAGLINHKVFVVHGGLAPEDFTLAEVNKIDRFVDSPEKCLMANLLWSDVINIDGLRVGRGDSSVEFGPDIAEKFLHTNNLDYIIRSHERKDEGFEIHPGGHLITVFSAPNYCDEDGNKGALIKFEDSQVLMPKIVQFSSVVHPPAPSYQCMPKFGILGNM